MSGLQEHTERAERKREAKPTLKEELKGWGFNTHGSGEHRLSEDGDRLIYDDGDGSEYLVAESTYYGSDTEPHRPFLAVALDALRLAAQTLAQD